MDALISLIMYAVIVIFVAAVLYFVIKKAVKDAIIEAKNELNPQ